MSRFWWIDRLTIIADILVVVFIAGICTILYGGITGDINIVSYGGGVMGLFLILLIAAKKFNKH